MTKTQIINIAVEMRLKEEIDKEREACAKIAEEHDECRASYASGVACDAWLNIAKKIRARGVNDQAK